MSELEDTKHIEGHKEKLLCDLKTLMQYDEINFESINAKRFRKILDDVENKFVVTIKYESMILLKNVKGVVQSHICTCMSNEFLKMLTLENGSLRRSLYYDNIRDFQGIRGVNEEIYQTITTDPTSFVLRNNGITIICDTYLPQGENLIITNPQIVNGCQTSTLLFKASKQGASTSDISIVLKLIQTEDPEVMGNIVRGTNTQNIVPDAAFETTRTFHKELEKVFEALSLYEKDENKRIYYERRSRQYSENYLLKQYQKINFRALIQSFVAVFLREPHNAWKHEYSLLKDYGERIFLDKQSKHPYFFAASISSRLEKMFIDAEINKREYYAYKHHIMFILKELLPQKTPNINNSDQIKSYCEAALKELADDSSYKLLVRKAIAKFDALRAEWIKDKGEQYRFGIKDSEEFTRYIRTDIFNSPQTAKSCGVVVLAKRDVYGQYYGFISNEPNDIFFHSSENPGLDFFDLRGKEVEYEIKNEKAVNISILS